MQRLLWLWPSNVGVGHVRPGSETVSSQSDLQRAAAEGNFRGDAALLETLLKSLGDDAPSGPNLEYEPVFAALDMAAQQGEERQAGNEIIEAEPPNYGDVIGKAKAVLEQSHDIRAAVHLGVAELHVNGFMGLAEATTYMRGCLEGFWDTCHPQLDADDDNDPTMRVNAVLGLSDAAMMKGIRLAPMTQSQAFGRVNLRDIEIANGEATASGSEDRVLDSASIAAAFKDTKEDVLQGIFSAARTVRDDLSAIDAAFDAQIPGQGPDLSGARKMMHRVVTRLAAETGGSAEAAAESSDDEAPAGTPSEAAPVSAPAGTISSPRDVTAALEKILAYYESHEPSSPLPVILKRAKRLVGADFMTIIMDIAPGGIDTVKMVGGLVDDD
jgi:type VI secretion system protein ImpA